MAFPHIILVPLLLYVLFQSEPVEPCTEIRDSSMMTYKTNRQAYIVETEIVVPLVLDLVQEYVICGKRYKSNTLATLFKNATEPRSRSKRLAPLIPIAMAVGAGLVTAAWAGYSYASINGKIDELREGLKQETNYLKQVFAEDQEKNAQAFLAVRREFAQLAAVSRETTCNVQTNFSMLVYEHYFYQEFDDIISSLRNERLTSSIIPPNQMLALVRSLPILQDTIYVESPYMLYFTGKITFNLAEMSGDILRGVLILPIIKNRRNIHFTVATREINSRLTVFKPVYITDPGQKSVDQCHHELDTYFCSEADLQPIQMTRLDAPILYADGMVLLNTGTRAEIKDKKNNDTLKTVIGPAICTTEETSTVIYGNRVLYTKTSAFHVKHETVEFDVDPFPITLELPAYTPLRFDRETAIEPASFRWQGSYNCHPGDHDCCHSVLSIPRY
ncbi:unnamed protein product [Bemisia tabaci]|uniref:Envelope protein n=1 Tax=Bemisia tabaci TaxID=7038 RepID=A0A9P0F0C4_BEMTA|nr:unnamed protein product [Bemisia tabaci]